MFIGGLHKWMQRVAVKMDLARRKQKHFPVVLSGEHFP